MPKISDVFKMVRLKKAASTIKAPSRAKPTAQPDTDDSYTVAEDYRKTKASGGQRRRASNTRRSSKKPAPRPRPNTTNENIDSDSIDEEDGGEANNDRDDDNDPAEADDHEENGNSGTNDDQAKDDEEEEETYKQVETAFLKAKMKLLLIDKMKGKPGSLRPDVARSERRLNSEVRELRKRLVEETTSEPEDSKKKNKTGNSKKAKSGSNKKGESDPSNNKKGKSTPRNKNWAIHGIIKESTYHYLVVWKGEDEDGQPWDDWWVAKREVNAAAKRDWGGVEGLRSKGQEREA